MSLSLKVITFKGQPVSTYEAVFFDRTGGTIGRSDENTLTISDPEKFVSRRHASISFENGHYIIKDSSLSGTYINSQETPLSNAEQNLADGMLLRIGEYEILVSITSEENEEYQDNLDLDLSSPNFAPIPDAMPFKHTTDSFSTSESLLHHFDNPENLLNQSSISNESPLLSPHENIFRSNGEAQSSIKCLMEENISPMRDSFIPPAPEPNQYIGNGIPDDFNFEDLFEPASDTSGSDYAYASKEFGAIEPCVQDDLQSSTKTEESIPINSVNKPNVQGVAREAEQLNIPNVPIPDLSNGFEPGVHVSPVSLSETDQALFNAFLQGAGIEREKMAPKNTVEKMRLIGSMFRRLVEGTVAVLRSRTEFKSQFRVTVTTIKTADNNPLKFAVTTDDTVCHLINDGQSGFKHSMTAIDEGYSDIMSHQMAMQAGIQAALAELFSRFDPKLIEKQFEEGLVLQKKSKCWDKYVNLYPGIVEQMTDNFFGEAFAEAYEKQMKRLAGTQSKK